jgi:hypothetical protein
LGCCVGWAGANPPATAGSKILVFVKCGIASLDYFF